jgi:hypothetical protein
MSSPQQNSIINNLPNNLQIPKPAFQKMLFIMNALDEGWSIKKVKDSYIFIKKHENRREVFQENYLDKFIETNTSGHTFLNSLLLPHK